MKICYRFINGETSEVEVPTEVYQAYLSIEKQEALSDRRETRRHVSMEELAEKGMQFPSEADVESRSRRTEIMNDLAKAIAMLSSDQQELIRRVFFEGESYAKIARGEGTTRSSVHQRMTLILRKIKKF